MCLGISFKKKYASIKTLKEGVRSGVGSGYISQRYGSADPDPHQHITDPQHCFESYHFLTDPTFYKSEGSRSLTYAKTGDHLFGERSRVWSDHQPADCGLDHGVRHLWLLSDDHLLKGRVSGVITSLPIVGRITACGIFDFCLNRWSFSEKVACLEWSPACRLWAGSRRAASFSSSSLWSAS